MNLLDSRFRYVSAARTPTEGVAAGIGLAACGAGLDNCTQQDGKECKR